MTTAVQGARPVALSWPPKPEELFEVWARDLGLPRPGAGPVTLPGGSLPVSGTLRPIAVPLSASGFEAAPILWSRRAA